MMSKTRKPLEWSEMICSRFFSVDIVDEAISPDVRFQYGQYDTREEAEHVSNQVDEKRKELAPVNDYRNEIVRVMIGGPFSLLVMDFGEPTYRPGSSRPFSFR